MNKKGGRIEVVRLFRDRIRIDVSHARTVDAYISVDKGVVGGYY